MKTSLYTLFAVFLWAKCCWVPVFSQSIMWQKSFGGGNWDMLEAIAETTDGGYILAGSSKSNANGDKSQNNRGENDYWIVKLNSNRNISWQKTIGGTSEDKVSSIIQTVDGGYLVGGRSNSPISNEKTDSSRGLYDYWVVKLSATGNIQWQRTLGGSDDDILTQVLQVADGGYLLVGFSRSGISGEKSLASKGLSDGWIVKLNVAGDSILWQKCFGGNYDDYLYRATPTSDGGYVLAFSSSSDNTHDKTDPCKGSLDYWIVKLNASMNKQWDKTIGGSTVDDIRAVYQTTNGAYIVAGSSNSPVSGDKTATNKGGYDYWFVRLSASGSLVIWQKTVGGSDDDYLRDFLLFGGEINLAGYSTSGISGDKADSCRGAQDYWVVRVNESNGIINDQITLGGNDIDLAYCLSLASDNGYLLGGASRSSNSGDKNSASKGEYDYWIVKLLPSSTTAKPTEIITTERYSVFPNPVSAGKYLQGNFPINSNILVTNVLGKNIWQQTIHEENMQLVASWLPGTYYICVRQPTGEIIYHQKIIVMP